MTEPSTILTRRDLLKLTSLSAATLLSQRVLAAVPQTSSSPTPAMPNTRKPNILVIMADDLGYGDLGCYGNTQIPTPHLDALAAGGLRFTDGYVTAPVCSPSRAGFLTGRYQQRCGHEFNGGATPGATMQTYGLPVSERTLADELQAAGYVTGIVGKWHLGMADRFHPLRRGFTECYCFLEAWFSYLNPQDDPRIIYRNLAPAQKTSAYLTDTFAREAQAFLHRHREEPFFLYLPFNAPHTPLQASDKYLQRFAHVADETKRTYMAMVSALDDGVGQVMQTLRDLNLEDNTLVLFLVDHGAPSHVTPGSNYPLRGHKAQVLEGGIRVPFLASWKGRIPPGICHEPVISLDIFPTALALAGRTVSPNLTLDGKSLLPLLLENPAPGSAPGSNPAPGSKPAPRQPLHDTLFWRMGPQQALRRGPWKLVRSKETPWQLYNLADDLGESTDRAAANPQVAQELLTAYQHWNAQLPPPREPVATTTD
ncbi:MAG: sulfatase-like hydrolase/transferase [Phycisphaeraceae bacterium]|nr:sulfatase-like hydrolase/transferase [Phycisphaeraceae bacterium]